MSNVLHFRGDCTKYDPRLIYGPDLWGAHYRAIGAEFDAEFEWSDGTLGRTTMQMKPVPPKELAELAQEMAKRAVPIWEGYYAQ